MSACRYCFDTDEEPWPSPEVGLEGTKGKKNVADDDRTSPLLILKKLSSVAGNDDTLGEKRSILCNTDPLHTSHGIKQFLTGFKRLQPRAHRQVSCYPVLAYRRERKSLWAWNHGISTSCVRSGIYLPDQWDHAPLGCINIFIR